ncbi:MAG TPA: DUF4435 domain-containing protein, partial [Candidatus Kapabacteria bacterium]|nr:DUF4435 domain-containing protein [Candidatus Kapabacteria bacterium]
QEIGSNSRKVVILVEGKDDKTAYELLFQNKYSNWEYLFSFHPVTGKDNVIKELENSPDFIGIIDKDEWWEEDIEKNKQKLSNLIVIPRYCMESYLVVPEEIWAALPGIQKEKIKYDDFRDAILENIEAWTKYAALWHAIQPLYYKLKDSGFNQELLIQDDRILDEEFIRATLNKWHGILDPEKAFNNYRALLSQITALSHREKLQKWIHGKEFWEKHVSQKLVKFFGQKSQKEYLREIWELLEIPGDWADIWPVFKRLQPELEEKKKEQEKKKNPSHS